MEIKKILVPLDSSPFTAGATETACRIAGKHDAGVAGVAVLDSPEIRSSVVPAIGPYYPMMIDAVQAKIRHADHVLKDAIERFATTCDEMGVRHLETEYEGIPAQKLLESSIFYDLIVVGLETAFHFETRGGQGDTLDKLLNRTATPVLAVPAKGMPALEKVIIAFDGSFGSSRALRDFMIMAKPFDPQLVVVAADLDSKQSDFLLTNASTLLESHGFSDVRTLASDKPVEKAFAEDVDDDADLIVAGIHSKHRFKDIFTGSFTARLIKEGRTSLFLSH